MLGILIGSWRCLLLLGLVRLISLVLDSHLKTALNIILASVQSNIMKIRSGASGGINGEIHGRSWHKFGMGSRYTKLSSCVIDKQFSQAIRVQKS